MQNIISMKNQIETIKSLDEMDYELLLDAKKKGFSDFQIARLIFNPEPKEIEKYQIKVRNHRKSVGIQPCIK